MKTEELKTRLLDSIGEWLEERIDALTTDHPRIAPASVYLKRGAHNYFCKERNRIDEMLGQAEMFIADENGNVNVNTLFDDLVAMFKEIEERPFHVGQLHGQLGKGAVSFDIPDNLICTLLFGDCGKIRFTTADFMKLKNMVSDCIQTDAI